ASSRASRRSGDANSFWARVAAAAVPTREPRRAMDAFRAARLVPATGGASRMGDGAGSGGAGRPPRRTVRGRTRAISAPPANASAPTTTARPRRRLLTRLLEVLDQAGELVGGVLRGRVALLVADLLEVVADVLDAEVGVVVAL